MALHRHEFHQFVLPRRGWMRIEIGGRDGVIDPRCAAFVPAGTRHAFEVSGDHDFLILDIARPGFPGSRVREVAFDGLERAPFFRMTPALGHLVAYAAGFSEAGGLPDAAAWVDLVLATLAPSAPDAGPLARARDHIEANLAETLTIAAIARAAGASERQLHRLFRSGLGTTPHAYLARRRIERAMALLSSTGMPIARIAHLTGHGDQGGLTRALKRRAGVTPAAYRRDH